MSITSYSELQAALADWINRDDISTARVQDFIRLAETQMNRALRCRELKTSGTANLSTTDTGISIPSTFAELIQIRTTGTWENDGGVVVTETTQYPVLEPVTDETLRNMGDPAAGVCPLYFSESADGSTWNIWGVSSNFTLTYTYYRTVPSLSGTNTTNAILTAYPDLYLDGSMAAVEDFLKLKADERGPWAPRFLARLNEINASNKQSTWSGGTFRVRSPY